MILKNEKKVFGEITERKILLIFSLMNPELYLSPIEYKLLEELKLLLEAETKHRNI